MLSRLDRKTLKALTRGRELACVALLLTSASCVPAGASELALLQTQAAVQVSADAPPALPDAPLPDAEPGELKDVTPADAAAINATIPLAAGANPRAPSTIFTAASAIDQERSLRCLAEAIFYEARSESEDGQRAVAQVVLNRVRHPAYPGSVCGVVYQGPMRAGGGCQFTFTCDGSLASAPTGFGWLRARRIAAAALAGSVYAPVGLATHYHTQQVLPVWAFRLAKADVIGNHIFYRMPGAWGSAGTFAKTYSGREPSPATVIANRLPVFMPKASLKLAVPVVPLTYAGISSASGQPLAGAVASAPSAPRQQQQPVNERLPASTVRPEFAASGRWLSDAPSPNAPGSGGTRSPASTEASAR